MRQVRKSTVDRLNLASGMRGGLNKKNNADPGSVSSELLATVARELVVAKIEFKLEQILINEPPLSVEQRDELCSFLNEFVVGSVIE